MIIRKSDISCVIQKENMDHNTEITLQNGDTIYCKTKIEELEEKLCNNYFQTYSCGYCGNSFITTNAFLIYCSQKCANNHGTIIDKELNKEHIKP